MTKKNDYSILLNKELRKEYKGNTAKVLGYILYSSQHYRETAERNDGWFGISDAEFKNEIGLSAKTLRLHISKLIFDDLIEKNSGKLHVVNQYRVTTKLTTKLTTGNGDNQRVTQKSNNCDGKVTTDDEVTTSISISNSISKSDLNKSTNNIEINKLKELTMELTEKISELEDRLMETNHLVEELIENKAKMETAIIELQTTVQACKQEKTNVEQVKSQSHHNYNEIGNFWQRWNQYKQNLKDGKTTDNYLNIYITKANKLFSGDNLKKVVEQLKEQYAYVTSKSQSQSPLQIRDEDKIYYNGEPANKEYLKTITNDMMWKLKYAPKENGYNHQLADFYHSILTSKSGLPEAYVTNVWNNMFASVIG